VDFIINFISKPDSWFIMFGVVWAVAVGGSRFLAKRFGWRPRFYLKPVAPPIEPSHVNNLIDQELRDWKSKYTTMEALLEVSRSQWTEKIEELTTENTRLKAERETQSTQTQTNQETKEEGIQS
jgi:hypothetical protein